MIIEYEEILKKKQEYYWKTEASYHFAAEEYADQFKKTSKLLVAIIKKCYSQDTIRTTSLIKFIRENCDEISISMSIK